MCPKVILTGHGIIFKDNIEWETRMVLFLSHMYIPLVCVKFEHDEILAFIVLIFKTIHYMHSNTNEFSKRTFECFNTIHISKRKTDYADTSAQSTMLRA